MMFRFMSRFGFLLASLLLIVFLSTFLINHYDPYRAVTEDLISQITAEPQRIEHLMTYGSEASKIRQSLHTEDARTLAVLLDKPLVSGAIKLLLPDWASDILLVGVNTAVHKIAAFDTNLALIGQAERLSGDLTQLHTFNLNNGDVVLADLYEQSQTISGSLAEVGAGLNDVAEVVSNVTTLPEVEAFQQELRKVGWAETTLLDQSIESWQSVPDNMQTLKRQMDGDVAWLTNFQQDYEAAKIINNRWQFDTLRTVPRLTADFQQPLRWSIVGSLLLIIVGWLGGQLAAPRQRPARRAIPRERPLPHTPQPKPIPSLAFHWADGRRDSQKLPTTGALTVGNIVIKRAKVRYYLERIDNGFPAFLNGQIIKAAHALQDGDIIQIGELQTVFQAV